MHYYFHPYEQFKVLDLKRQAILAWRCVLNVIFGYLLWRKTVFESCLRYLEKSSPLYILGQI